MSLAILFHFLCAQHVSDTNISIIRSLRLCCWITTLVIMYLVRCVLDIRCGWVGVVSVLQASAFEGKTPREVHPGGLVLARQCPVSLGTCNQEETSLTGLPVSWSPSLFSGSGPVELPPVPRTEKKNNWKVAIFRPTRRSLLPRRPGWTDKLMIFFWVACKS